MIKNMCNKVSSSTNQKKKERIIRKWNDVILKTKSRDSDISLISINEIIKSNSVNKGTNLAKS